MVSTHSDEKSIHLPQLCGVRSLTRVYISSLSLFKNKEQGREIDRITAVSGLIGEFGISAAKTIQELWYSKF